MCFAHTWTPDFLLTQSTQMGRLSPHSTSATLRTNPVNTEEGEKIIYYLNALQTCYGYFILSCRCFTSFVLLFVNSYRCYQGEPLLYPPKQHHSSSLPAYLPGTYLQFAQGDSKNIFFFFKPSQNILCSFFFLPLLTLNQILSQACLRFYEFVPSRLCYL